MKDSSCFYSTSLHFVSYWDTTPPPCACSGHFGGLQIILAPVQQLHSKKWFVEQIWSIKHKIFTICSDSLASVFGSPTVPGLCLSGSSTFWVIFSLRVFFFKQKDFQRHKKKQQKICSVIDGAWERMCVHYSLSVYQIYILKGHFDARPFGLEKCITLFKFGGCCSASSNISTILPF